jgi:hypothetical protein
MRVGFSGSIVFIHWRLACVAGVAGAASRLLCVFEFKLKFENFENVMFLSSSLNFF